MRNNENNIILHVRNITLYLENIISFPRILKRHLTEKAKIITLVSVIIMLSSINIINVSALSYSNSIGIGFTFNPTLSISLSSSDLVINDLVPGSTLDSNAINVSVASNASYGYTLSAIVNGNNSNLTHSNNTNNIFSSIATNADLSSLENSEDDNIWGYSYKDNTIVSPSWSNYNGLSSSNSTTLINTNNNVSSNLDFRIAAKASNTQPSGEYTNTINFIAVSKVAPMSLLDSFIASGAEQLNGYFKMQDMTHSICSNVDIEESELQLIDVRDNKIYWVAKLKDGNCWMTQNLELDLIANSTILNSTNTDIDVESYNSESGAYSPAGGYSKDNNTNIVTWSPARNTTTSISSDNFPATAEANNMSYSYNPGDAYYYPAESGKDGNNGTAETLTQCTAKNHTNCERYKAGNYYSWSAAVASNNTIALPGNSQNTYNSICPKNWRLPQSSSNNFKVLANTYHLNNDNALDLRNSPLYFVRTGNIRNGVLNNSGSYGFYWSEEAANSNYSYNLRFYNGSLSPYDYNSRYLGFPIRCITE